MTWSAPPPEMDNPTMAAAHPRAMREQHGVDSPEARAAFGAHLAEVMAAEVAEPEPGLWWLSFVDTTKSAPPDEQVPGGGGFLGIIIVSASGFMQAVLLTHALGINPGGEVQGFGPLPVEDVGEKWWGRLLTKADTDEIEAETIAKYGKPK